MLVNISYSIDFDEVPKIVKGFLENDVHTELTGQVTEAVNEAICALEDKNENTVRAIQKVEQIREALVKLDMRLSDCSSILKGYQRELLTEPPVQAQEAAADTDLASIQQDLGKLVQQMKEAEIGSADR
jgi:uncharacterized protein YqeY